MGGVSTPGRAKRGVWAGKTIVTGHKVSYSNRRQKRKFFPNTQPNILWREMLQRWIRVSLTAHALRCVERVGGFDEYMLYSKPHEEDDTYFSKMIRKQLIGIWEKEHGKKFNRSKAIYEARLEQLELDRQLELKRWQDITDRTKWERGQDEKVVSQQDFDNNQFLDEFIQTDLKNKIYVLINIH